MSDKTPTNKKTAEKSRSSNSSPRESPPPLSRDSFTRSPSDRRTSNTHFGAIGGPAAPPPFRHATSIANLGAGSNTRALQTNEPGRSYVTNLPTPTTSATSSNSRRESRDSPWPSQDAPPHFRHATSIANLGAGSNTRALQTNQSGRSYVTNLPTWRYGPGKETAPTSPHRSLASPRSEPATPSDQRIVWSHPLRGLPRLSVTASWPRANRDP